MSADQPTPADVTGARVVVLCAPKRVWESPHLTLAAAQELFDSITTAVNRIGDGPGMVDFGCSHGRQARVRARELDSIELRNATVAPAEQPRAVAAPWGWGWI